MKYVCWFGELDRDDLPLAGGKGTSLAEMTRAGLPVPPGFVLTTVAYRDFVTTAGLEAEIERLAAQANIEEPSTVDEASAKLRTLIERTAIPEAIRQEIAAAYAQLGGGPVAARSSANAEDLPGASFAGQHESYLNVAGAEAVEEAIRRCWSSLWTARAIAYRTRQGIPAAVVCMAVVVQRLIPAEVAGILFTANPVNGRRDQMVVDATWGLGEAIVSGQVTPDHWVMEAATGKVVEAKTARKEVKTVLTTGGTELLPVDVQHQEQPVLDIPELLALIDLGRRAEAHFGSPQDIEWALEGGRLYLLQSRPITSLFPIPAPSPPPEAGLRVYACVNFLQGFPEPFTPMGVAAFRNFARGGAILFGSKLPPPGVAPGPFKVAAGRIFFDITPVLQNPKSRKAALTAPQMIDRPMAEILALLLNRDPSLSPPEAKFPFNPPKFLLIRGAVKGLITLLSPGLGRQMAKSGTEGQVRRLAERAAGLKGVEERVQFFEEEGERLVPSILPILLPLIVPAMASRFLAEAKLKAWLGDASGLQPVLRSLPHNPTTEMDLALWKVSRQLKAEGRAPSAEHPAVRHFLEVYGHRGVREIDIGMPRWREDPTPVLAMLRNYLAHGEESDPAAQFQRGAVEAEKAAHKLVAQVRKEKGFLRAVLLRFLMSRMRALLGMREYPKFMAVKAFGIFRQVVAGAGEELVAAGRLDRAEDVFFLDLRDLVSSKDLRALAAANRAEYRRELERRPVPRVVTSTGEAFYGTTEAPEGALVGTPASAGIHEGPVRVIRDPRGASLKPGEVLVAPGTDPAWTPLFLTAGALVMEIGGIMSHGSVVAREYGIPAVVGVPGATERLHNGQRVRVDGESGLVVPLD